MLATNNAGSDPTRVAELEGACRIVVGSPERVGWIWRTAVVVGKVLGELAVDESQLLHVTVMVLVITVVTTVCVFRVLLVCPEVTVRVDLPRRVVEVVGPLEKDIDVVVVPGLILSAMISILLQCRGAVRPNWK